MANYLFSIVAASVFVAVLCAAAPEEEGLGKFVAFAGALTVALIALSPLAGCMDEWIDKVQTEWGSGLQNANGKDDEQSAEYFAYSIAATAAEIYDMEIENISVSVYPAKDEKSFVPDKVCVVLPTGTHIDTEDASQTLSNLFSCTVLVETEERGAT